VVGLHHAVAAYCSAGCTVEGAVVPALERPRLVKPRIEGYAVIHGAGIHAVALLTTLGDAVTADDGQAHAVMARAAPATGHVAGSAVVEVLAGLELGWKDTALVDAITHRPVGAVAITTCGTGFEAAGEPDDDRERYDGDGQVDDEIARPAGHAQSFEQSIVSR
jgi:hypothetical protein